ncbi:hypothetical protein [Saliphagus infecundisoli]|uniref:Uncharacterized protein n=1 Tax=Saliphagus infecundisoli TaxID=1849069 RepID=A0ABD5QDX2_9EURY|nr:hypothetical protein [Saliphagus infecundisoli]
MTAAPVSLLERVENPEHTGENRCLPCTVVNVVLAGALSVAVGVVSPLAGVLAFAVGIATIRFRGYLVPGTPRLTKRYFPSWLLDRFGKFPAADAEEIDVERYLLSTGVVVDDRGADDLKIDPGFEDRWRRRIREVRGESADRKALAELVGVRPDTLDLEWYGDAFVARIDGEWIGQWESRSAFVADVAASRALEERAGREWSGLPLAARSEVLGALRLFLERCPTCEGEVAFEQEVVDSCCRSYDVVAARCTACDDRLLEVGI